MKNILVLGAGGMAGHVIAQYLREKGYLVDTLSANKKLDDKTLLMDVTDIDKFRHFLSINKYDVIVNCIGILVKESENRKDLSTFLNSYFPHFLEESFQHTSTKIIHLSTDCVFSGHNPPYKENSEFDGQLFYDRSKALGEIINDKDLTFRMSIIGPDMQESGIGLFNWFYAQNGHIMGYSKSIWNGITTVELAKGIQAAIEQDLKGLYHLVPDDSIAKSELLRSFRDTFNRDDIEIEEVEGIPADKTLINTRSDFLHQVPPILDMIKEMKAWIESHKDLYPHYRIG